MRRESETVPGKQANLEIETCRLYRFTYSYAPFLISVGMSYQIMKLVLIGKLHGDHKATKRLKPMNYFH